MPEPVDYFVFFAISIVVSERVNGEAALAL